MARSSGPWYLRCFYHHLERDSLRIATVSIGLLGAIIGRAQGVEMTAGFVHGWGAELVNQDQIKASGSGNGWRLTADYHFGADTLTHMSIGVGWSTVYWSQKFHLVQWYSTGPYGYSSRVYDRSGSMETRTGQVFLVPMLSLHLLKGMRLLVGADLGLTVQAHRHERSSGADTMAPGEYQGHGSAWVDHIAVDSTYNDMDQMNPFFLAAFVGFECSVVNGWSIRAEGVPYSSRFTTSSHPSSRPAYVRLIIGYCF